ncbi:hypothetical protein ABZ135_38515 [Streptomyces sp. NPDC006339]|uniref:hypothetical protein n=1 Tax=Streptomyces sp. NPDC006339 TaxID=3156755 RepID=UPI0033B3E6C4
MTDMHLRQVTTAEWGRQVGRADLVVGPSVGVRDAITGDWDAGVHIATGDRLTEDVRQELISELVKAVSTTVHRVLGTREVRTTVRTEQSEETAR